MLQSTSNLASKCPDVDVDPSLSQGSYYVKAACPKDYRHSKLYATSATKVHPVTQVSESFDVSIDRATTGINAGCYKPALVEGVVFSDKNTNSIQDTSTLLIRSHCLTLACATFNCHLLHTTDEGGVADVAVELTKSTDTTFRLKIRTDADGKFRFPDLEPSDYALYIIYDAKYYNSPISAMKESTSEEGGKIKHRSVTLRVADQPSTKDGRKQLVVSPLQLSSGDRATIKQGLYTLAKVEGVVFRDENANGIWDGREKTLASVKVTLYRVGESGDVAVSQMKSDEVLYSDTLPPQDILGNHSTFFRPPGRSLQLYRVAAGPVLRRVRHVVARVQAQLEEVRGRRVFMVGNKMRKER